jgi:hypothetical protein
LLGDRGGGLLRLGGGVGIVLLRHRLDRRQRPVARGPRLRRLAGRPRIGDVRRRLGDRCLIEARVDLVESLSSADQAAFSERAGADDPGDLRADLRHFERARPPGKLDTDPNVLRLQRDEPGFRGWRLLVFGIASAAGRQQSRHGKRERRGADRAGHRSEAGSVQGVHRQAKRGVARVGPKRPGVK